MQKLTFFDKMQLARKAFEASEPLADIPAYKESNEADQGQLILYDNFLRAGVAPKDDAMLRLRTRVSIDEALHHLDDAYRNRRVVSSECRIKLVTLRRTLRKLRGDI